MAPRYGTYQRQVSLNQPIQVPPDIDQAAMRETGKMYGELAQRAQQVQNFAFKRAEQTAISEGTAAGSQNPEQVLAQYGGQRPTDIYGQAAFDAANKIGGVQLEAKAREAIGNAYINAKKTKQDPNDFQAGLGAIISGYTSALEDMDPLTAARTRAKLQSYARSAFLDRSADAIKEQQKILDGDATSITDSMLEHSGLMGQVATRGGDQEFKVAMANYKDSMEELGQTPKAIQANIAKAKNLYHIARVRREFRDAKDKGAFLKKFRKDRKTGKGLARGIDDLRIESLTISFERDIVQADRLRTAKIRDINSQIDDGFDILTKNGSIGDKDIDEFRKQAGDVGDEATVKRVDFLERENNELKDIGRGGSVAMLQAANKARVTIEAARRAGKTTPEYLLDKEKRLRKAAEARRKLEERDPMAAAAAAHGAPTMPMLSVADIIRDPQNLKDHIRANLNASGMYDVAPVYMTQDTISKLKVAFEKTNTDFDTQAALVSSIQEAAGPLAPRVFAQIASQTEASDLAHVGALMNPEVMEAYFKGRQAIASGTRVDEPLQGSMKNDLNKMLGASMQLKPVLYGDLLAASEAVYLARHAGERYDKDKYENIVHELVGGRFTGKDAVGGLVEHKGRALILPRDFARDDDAFESAFDSITDVSLRSVATERGTPVFRNPLSGEYEEISASSLRKDYNLMPYGAGLYVLTDRAGNHVAAGDLIEMPDGTTFYEERRDPYVLDFSKVTGLQEPEVAPQPVPTSSDTLSPEEYPDQSIQPDMTEEYPDQSIQPDMPEEYPDQSIQPDMPEEYPDQSIQSDMPEEYSDQNIAPSTAIKAKLSTQEMQQMQTANTKGRQVVDSAVRAVDALFGGGSFLTRIAKVESDFGDNPETFKRISKGIWQIDPIGFKETRRNTNKLRKARDKIKSEFGIDYMQLKHADLQKPLYGALAARLFLLSRAKGPLPTTLEGQAKLWKRIYNTEKGRGTVEQFINKNSGT